jgi:hypothetical protein
VCRIPASQTRASPQSSQSRRRSRRRLSLDCSQIAGGSRASLPLQPIAPVSPSFGAEALAGPLRGGAPGALRLPRAIPSGTQGCPLSPRCSPRGRNAGAWAREGRREPSWARSQPLILRLPVFSIKTSGASCSRTANLPTARRPTPVPIVKLFTPRAECVWLVAEIHPDDGDTAMGLIDNGQGLPVMGYFRLSEITCPSKTPVYKDLNFLLPVSATAPPFGTLRRRKGRIHHDVNREPLRCSFSHMPPQMPRRPLILSPRCLFSLLAQQRRSRRRTAFRSTGSTMGCSGIRSGSIERGRGAPFIAGSRSYTVPWLG